MRPLVFVMRQTQAVITLPALYHHGESLQRRHNAASVASHVSFPHPMGDSASAVWAQPCKMGFSSDTASLECSDQCQDWRSEREEWKQQNCDN